MISILFAVPSEHKLRRVWKTPNCRWPGRHWHTVRQRTDQVLPHVRGAHRKGRGLRPDDVQALQARLLLVLPGQFGCKFLESGKSRIFHLICIPAGWLPAAPLRQGTVQEQAGALAGLGGLASCPSDWDLRRLWHSAAGGLAAAALGCSLHHLLQVPRVHRVQDRRGGRRTGGGGHCAAGLGGWISTHPHPYAT